MPDVADVSSGLPRRSMESRGGTQIADDGTITYKGKEPSDWTPEEFAAFGKEFGVGNLGPLSKVTRITDDVGRDIASIPGGLDGKFTYYDLLWLKANPVDVASLPVELHGKLTAKLARTMTPWASCVPCGRCGEGAISSFARLCMSLRFSGRQPGRCTTCAAKTW